MTGVCDAKAVELVRSLGAQEVLDRFREDFTKSGKSYDVIFDAVGKHSFRRCRRSLNPGGIYLTVDLGFLYHVPLVALVTRFAGSRRAKLGIGRYRKRDLALVKQLIDEGKYRPVIDRTYTLDEVVEATRYVESRPEDGQRRAPRQNRSARLIPPEISLSSGAVSISVRIGPASSAGISPRLPLRRPRGATRAHRKLDRLLVPAR